jgi:hypothetical protein
MQAKFAKAIAKNIRIIAEETARIALIDTERQTYGHTISCEARVRCTQAIEKAENNIAALLQQPGAHLTT